MVQKLFFLLFLWLTTYSNTQAQLPTGSNLLGVRLDWHPLGEMIAAADHSSVHLYDADGVQIIRSLPSFPNLVTDVAWNPDGTKLAVANGYEIQIWQEPWNVNALQPELIIQSPTVSNDLGIVSVDWHPSAEKILGVNTPNAYIWDTATGQLIETVTSEQSAILSAIWHKDGEQIIRGDVIGGVVVENLANDTREFSEFFDRSGVYALSWSPAGDKVAAGSGSGILQIFGFSPFFTGNGYIETETGKIISLAWNPSDEYLIASGSTDGNVAVWNLQTQQTVVDLQAGSAVPSVDWSADGQKLAYGFEGGFDVVDVVGVSTLTPSTAPTATPAISLRSIFNPPSCAVSCWLGIEPGVTTQQEVRDILADLGIPYTVNPVSFPPVGTGEENGLYNFNVTSMPFINSQGFVAVHFADGIAGMIQIPVIIPSSMILQEYGSPYAVVVSDDVSLSIVYPEYRMAFLTSVETIQSYFYYLEIGTERTVSNYFLSIDSFSAFVEDCETVPGSCLFATATPSG